MATAGDLVVSLTANTSKFSGGINKARGDLRGFASMAGSTMSSMLGPIAAVAAGYLSINAAISLVSKSITASGESLKQSLKLDAVLEATGNAAGLAREEYDKLAKSIQKTTNIDDDSVTGAMAMIARQKTITGEVFTRATHAAADLASVMETDVGAAADMMAKALASPADGLTKLTRAGILFTDEQKNAIESLVEFGDVAAAQGMILDVLEGQVGNAAERMADPFTQLGNTVGDIFEAIGTDVRAFADGLFEAGLIEGVDSLKEGIESLAPVFKELGKEAVPAIRDVANSAKELADFMKTAGDNVSTTIDALKILKKIAMPSVSIDDIERMGKGAGERGNPLDIAGDIKPIAEAVAPAIKDAIKAAGKNDDLIGEWDAPLQRRKIGKRRPDAEITDKPKDYGLDSTYRIEGIRDEKRIGGPQGPQFAGAMEQGSREAYSTIVNAMGAAKDKIAGEQLSVQKQMLKEIKKTGITQNTPDLTVIERFA